MSILVDYTNNVSPEMFGDLTDAADGHGLTAVSPVLATPTAVALGVAIGAVALHAGYMVGIARNMAEGKYPKVPQELPQ
ncbi:MULTISPECIES: hypothetical protein [Sphaerimonospora]|uniref:Uncharacterized protein n=2 Tax=Sphaerimonospora TaxID=1792303 RepID=A0A8J3VZH6_9ACTN|nr:hypothetical protein [Sphaerimonospora thailandensis]GIH70100.1 hypothetical protein Mth01_23530 [Sphaerimonospora thailandensis]